MLGWASVAEAAAWMGRPLTAAEVTWFRVTAGVSDAHLYYLNIVFLFLIFNLAPLPTLLLDLLSNPHSLPPTKSHAPVDDHHDASMLMAFARRFKIQPSVRVPPSSIFNCYKTVMLTFFCVVLPLQIFSYPLVKVRRKNSRNS